MRRYKELKYDGQIYTEQYKIDEILIKNGFNWFLDCEVENTRIEIQFETLIFNSGVFFNGTWVYGVFRDGEWKNGYWDNGVWYNGIWRRGIFNSGLIFNGKFFNGKIEKDTTIRGGNFYDIEIDSEVNREDKYKIEKGEDTETPKPKKLDENIEWDFEEEEEHEDNLNVGSLVELVNYKKCIYIIPDGIYVDGSRDNGDIFKVKAIKRLNNMTLFKCLSMDFLSKDIMIPYERAWYILDNFKIID